MVFPVPVCPVQRTKNAGIRCWMGEVSVFGASGKQIIGNTETRDIPIRITFANICEASQRTS